MLQPSLVAALSQELLQFIRSAKVCPTSPSFTWPHTRPPGTLVSVNTRAGLPDLTLIHPQTCQGHLLTRPSARLSLSPHQIIRTPVFVTSHTCEALRTPLPP